MKSDRTLTEISETLLAHLSGAGGAWVDCDTLARMLYDVEDCSAAGRARIRKRIELLRAELPDGVTIETGFKMGYKLVDARVAA